MSSRVPPALVPAPILSPLKLEELSVPCTRPWHYSSPLGCPLTDPSHLGAAPALHWTSATSCHTSESVLKYPQLAPGLFLFHSHYGFGIRSNLLKGRAHPAQSPVGLGSSRGTQRLAVLKGKPGIRSSEHKLPAAAGFIVTRISWSCGRGRGRGTFSLMPYSQAGTQGQSSGQLCPASSPTPLTGKGGGKGDPFQQSPQPGDLREGEAFGSRGPGGPQMLRALWAHVLGGF